MAMTSERASIRIEANQTNPMVLLAGHLSAILLSTLGCMIHASADVIVLPSRFETREASDFDSAPLGLAIQRAQQVYGNSLLKDLSIGDRITGITFRVDGPGAAVPAQTVANYEIRLSQSANAPGSLDHVFANNRGADELIVRSGPLTIGAGDFPVNSPPNPPNPFGVIIPFTTPYVFNGGPLLVEFAHDGFPQGGEGADAQFPAVSENAQAAFGTGFDAAIADIGLYNEAIVIQLQVGAVPEPSMGLLSMTLFVGVGYSWRRR